MQDFQDMFNELFELEDAMDKYDYIIEYGAIARPVFSVSKTDANLVHGCTSNLWVEKIDNNIYCYGESLIVQGIASMICAWYNQASQKQQLDFSLNTLTNIGLAPLLSMGRQNGVANLIAKIKTL
jgi:cysteine desulfuration protein SufE